MRPGVKFTIVGVVGLLLIIIGSILYAIFPSIVENKVKESMKLEENGGLMYDTWKDVPVPLYMRYYFFHVVNPEDVAKHNAKPRLEEKGPYTYREVRKKGNIKWNPEEDTVSYIQNRTYFFERDLSVGDTSDLVTVPNIPVISAIDIGRRTQPHMVTQLAGITSGVELYVTKSVRELLFDGYVDPTVSLIQKATKEEFLPGGVFALFHLKNDTDDEEYTVYTGQKDVSKLAVIARWNGSSELNIWPENTTCNEIKGTDGAQFPPFIKKDFKPFAFMSEVCRSTYLVYEKEVTHFGITNYRFTSDIGLFADPSINPDNECYCESKKCMFTGFFNLAKCQKDAPIYSSNPHFYQTDPILLRTVEGLEPDKEKHQIILDIEPLTGVVMNAARRAQINVEMNPVDDPRFWTEMNAFGKMPRTYHPVLWFSETATIDEANVAKFKEMAVTPVKIGTGAIIAIIVLGVILILAAGGGYFWHKQKRDSGFGTTVSSTELTKR